MTQCRFCQKWGAHRCDESHCDIAGPGEPGNPNQCRPCWLRLGKPPVNGPSMVRRAWNYAQAIYNHVRRGKPVVSEEEALRRLALCEACELFDADKRICLHQKCGCLLDRKVTWAEQKCPLGKW